ncbi:phage tail tape measure protein [Pseudohoeflea coraliihabitans]|uniref:Phage tail tape measure protein n=1 Tax=Pseudohoeflea coraliihabitans TaxID=2860393 RepID=A0ABS6WTC0_9HYPH|nr:phage tail tape measure protein [Pseudohoeflea sp. DP4N28-3]MBW3098667.1 phage tail tape measure protein [Pseudohoeflea sp. DP4N28-3]
MADDESRWPDYDLEAVERGLGELEARADRFGAAITSALKSAIIEGRTLDDVLKSLGRTMSGIALDAGLAPLKDLVSQAASGLTANLTSGLTSSLTSGLGRIMPFAEGGVPGPLTPFAEGGVVDAPTFFPMAGGETGLMGEAGSEAILPLRRGSDGRLGVAAPGGQGDAVNVTFNITTPDAESFRRSEAQISAMLARSVARGNRLL